MDVENFGMRLSKLRNERNISARDFSLRIGQNPGYINKIENMKNLPSMQIFFYMCEFLKVTPAQFFDEKIDNPIVINQILLELEKMDTEKLNHVLSIVRDIND
ncbi:MAG: helix-turn-helix domain-containing protein [Acetatifactor sp.]